MDLNINEELEDDVFLKERSDKRRQFFFNFIIVVFFPLKLYKKQLRFRVSFSIPIDFLDALERLKDPTLPHYSGRFQKDQLTLRREFFYTYQTNHESLHDEDIFFTREPGICFFYKFRIPSRNGNSLQARQTPMPVANYPPARRQGFFFNPEIQITFIKIFQGARLLLHHVRSC